MNHIVLLNTRAKDLDHILTGKKTMLLRGSMGQKIPYKHVKVGDKLYFINNTTCSCVLSSAKVISTYFSDRLSIEESNAIVDEHQDKLLLNTALRKKYAGKRYLSIIEFDDVIKLDPIEIDPSIVTKTSDWFAISNLESKLVS